MQTFSPISSNKLYIQIYNQIREAILSGSYKVGDKLPSEKEFCQMFNVSRVPVREALCALELNGLVDSLQGVGVYVKQTSIAADETMQDVEPQDIIRARMTLEPDIARDAAQNITPEEKTRLADIIERFRAEAEADEYAISTDKDFHLCIARASGNALYYMTMELILKAQEQKMWEMILSRTIATKRYREQNYKEHMYIAKAIMDGEADVAYRTMKAHMENLVERYWS